MKKLLQLIVFALISLPACFESNGCTTFCIKDDKNLVLGKSFDFFTGVGHVVINNRNVKKSSFSIPFEKQFSWTSKYGSLTFNQLGREFPYGGINEKGLVIEQMWLADTKYPEMDQRYGLFELQWIQYQLDNSTTIEDVLATDAMIRISKMSGPIHFLVCDAQGHIATIEFLDGKMVSHTQSTLQMCVLTNDTYQLSKNYVNSLPDLKQQYGNSSKYGSFDRFAIATMMVENFAQQSVIDYAFDILKSVRQPEFTRWNIVYDIKNMTVHYKTQNNVETRSVSLTSLDFSCDREMVYIDIEENMKNNALVFHPYSFQKNLETMSIAFAKMAEIPEFKALLPKPEEIELLAQYPETMHCDE